MAITTGALIELLNKDLELEFSAASSISTMPRS